MTSNDAPQSPLTIRSILQGKEAGSIIGRGGEVINRFRDESGACINIAAGTAMERMLTVSGATDSVFQAFQLIMVKLADQSDGRGPGDLDLKLVVPASQCDSIIAKIKEIREETGATIQVAKEMLPNSTECTATVTGSPEQIAHCVELISYIMLESPPKGANIPYEPLGGAGGGYSGRGPGFSGGPGNFPGGGDGRNNGGNFGGNFNSMGNFNGGGGGGGPIRGRGRGRDLDNYEGNFGGRSSNFGGNFGGGGGGGPIRGRGRGRDHDNYGGNFGGRSSNFGGNFGGGGNNQGNFGANFNHFEDVTTHEMRIPNEQAGSVIGKGGSRIAEIRQTTGATVTISNMEESEDGGKQERVITIKGHSEQIEMAVYMINNR